MRNLILQLRDRVIGALNSYAVGSALVLNGGAAVVLQGTTFVVALLLTNVLGPVAFGRYFVAQNTITTLGMLAQAGLGFTATAYVARWRTKDLRYALDVARFCVMASVLIGGIIAMSMAVCADTLASELYSDNSLRVMLWLSGAAIPFAALSMVQVGILVGLERFGAVLTSALAYSVSLLALVYVASSAAGAVGAAGALVAATVLRAGILQISVSRVVRAISAGESQRRSLPAIWRSIRAFALPAGLAALTLTPAVWIGNAILVSDGSIRDLGLFSAAFMVKTLVAFGPIQIGTVFLPRYLALHSDTDGPANAALGKVVFAVCALSAALGTIIYFASVDVMSLFGREFTEGANLLAWMMPVAVVESVASILSFRLVGEQKMWTSLLLYTVPKDVLLIVVALVAIPEMGAVGLAWAHLASWTYAVVVLLVLWRYTTGSDKGAASTLP